MCAKTIGVLAVQGAFIEHEQRLRGLGCSTVELRQATDLDKEFEALVLPGGESTAQAKLLRDLGMLLPLRKRIAGGLPVLGTCAGLILLAGRIVGTGDTSGLDQGLVSLRTPVEGFATLPVAVQRNAYGRQLGSFHTQTPLKFNGESKEIPATFIRAPYITEVDPGVDVLARVDGRIVAVRYRNQIGVAFHPELDRDNTLYKLFLGLSSG